MVEVIYLLVGVGVFVGTKRFNMPWYERVVVAIAWPFIAGLALVDA